MLIVDFIIHVDEHVSNLIAQFGPLFYVIVFLILFCETGLVVTPFLPGDSFLFVLGAFAAKGSLSLPLLLVIALTAVILGDLTNYTAGKKIGRRVFSFNTRLIKKEHLEKTEAFYAKYGRKMIIMARFVPIVRTFAPFVAGMGNMPFRSFISFSIIGAISWVVLFTLLGFFFGNIQAVAHNFTIAIFAIIGLSLIPPIIEAIRARKEKKSETPTAHS